PLGRHDEPVEGVLGDGRVDLRGVDGTFERGGDPRARGLDGRRVTLSDHDVVAVTDGHLGDPRPHEAAAHDPDALRCYRCHVRSPSFDESDTRPVHLRLSATWWSPSRASTCLAVASTTSSRVVGRW